MSSHAAPLTHDATAMAVRTLSSLAQLATGPVAGVVIEITTQATLVGIASAAASSATAGAPRRMRREALAYAIGRVQAEKLCTPATAHVWRIAIGEQKKTKADAPAHVARAAGHAFAGVALARAIGKGAGKTLLRGLAVLDLVRLPHRARGAAKLVARTRYHARVFCDLSTRVVPPAIVYETVAPLAA